MCKALEIHWQRAPPVYEAQRLAAGPLTIDGDLDKPEWRAALWSAPFDDIRGAADAPIGARPAPGCQTRFKMLWDDEFLYVAALLEYDADMPVIATFTQRNSPIFHEDSDFEVFLDPDSSCHNYKELELNALNTVWNLMLDKPYADGGSEHSGRVAALGQPRFYDVTRQRTATRLVRGRISTAGPAEGVDGQEQNSEQNGPAAWAVELALSHTETIFGTAAHAPPRVGSAWRINFSRVERRGGVNWTWAAQRAWDASVRRFGGMVDMHRPEAWGYVVFAGVGGLAGRLECSGEGGSEREAHGGALESGEGSEAAWGGAVGADTAPVGLSAAGRSARRLGLLPALKAAPVDGQGGGPGRGPGGGAGGKPSDQGLALGSAGSGWLDPLWPARLVAACCYYAQRQYFEDHGRYATNLSDLRLEDAVVAPFQIGMELTRPAGGADAATGESAHGFVVRVGAGPKLGGVTVRHDRLFGLEPLAVGDEMGGS